MTQPEMKFEQALSELEQIVQLLERGDVPLDEAIAKFQEGITLTKLCNDTLTKAEETVNQMIVKREEAGA